MSEELSILINDMDTVVIAFAIIILLWLSVVMPNGWNDPFLEDGGPV